MAIGQRIINMADDRKRIYAFIAYPDEKDFPKNWLDILRSSHVDVVVSPLHEPDKEVLYNELEFSEDLKKKNHFHVVLMFDGKRSVQQVKDMLGDLGPCITRPFEIYSRNGYLRYLIHLDNPEKQQFASDLKDAFKYYTCFGQAADKVQQALTLGEFDAYKVQGEILDFVREHKITEITHLLGFADLKDNWLYVLQKYPCKLIYSTIASYRYQNSSKYNI